MVGVGPLVLEPVIALVHVVGLLEKWGDGLACTRLLLVVDVHGERSVIALAPVGEAADLHPGETIHPLLGHKAVVDVERCGFIPLMVVAGIRLLAVGLAGETMMLGAD